MKSHFHISKNIKEKAEGKINGLIRILSNHADFKRIEFGTSLWKSVILPSIAHGCSVWFHTSEADLNILESMQYQAAKVLLKTRLNPPKCAIIRELGWEPINEYLNRQRIAYFARMNKLSDTRLCKIVFFRIKIAF